MNEKMRQKSQKSQMRQAFSGTKFILVWNLFLSVWFKYQAKVDLDVSPRIVKSHDSLIWQISTLSVPWIIMVGTTKGTGISLFLEKFRNPGTVPGTRVPRILAVPKSSHGTQIPGTLGTGTKILGIVQWFWALGLKSLGQKTLGLAVPSHAHPWFFMKFYLFYIKNIFFFINVTENIQGRLDLIFLFWFITATKLKSFFNLCIFTKKWVTMVPKKFFLNTELMIT